MELAQSDSIIEPQIQPCKCFKVASLIQPILDSTQTSHFKDQYILGKQLGWGQFGIIRECSNKLTGEVLACKSIAKERLVTQEDVRSIKLEIEIMTRLSGHPNVVDLKAVYEEEEYVHLLMELCAGGELFHRIEKHGRFSEYEARVLFRQLIQVVVYCHDKGIVHRDLKPENILLTAKSSSSPIKLADFGLATYIKHGKNLQGTVGSPFYIAPEVLIGGYNQAADVWSAGVILYILLSGMPPFWGTTKSKIFDAVRAADLRFPRDHWDYISAPAKDLITGMLCVDASKRLTAMQVLAHLWMKDPEATQEPHKHTDFRRKHLEAGVGSFTTPIIGRNLDYSFNDGSPAISDSEVENSPSFTCRSSFSSFLVGSSTPWSISGGFSFSSCCETDAPEISSPVRALPSFTFFSPISTVDQGSGSLGRKSKMLALDQDSSPGPLFLLPDASQELEHRTEFRRGGGTSGSKAASTHSKRNHTIGHGELDQLDLMATESVIRWASCTNLPSASSLRSSLVC